MCHSLWFKDAWFNTPRELAILLGGPEQLVWAPEYSVDECVRGEDGRDTDSCLCHVDLEATLRKAGFTWSRGSDPMDWTIETGPTRGRVSA